MAVPLAEDWNSLKRQLYLPKRPSVLESSAAETAEAVHRNQGNIHLSGVVLPRSPKPTHLHRGLSPPHLLLGNLGKLSCPFFWKRPSAKFGFPLQIQFSELLEHAFPHLYLFGETAICPHRIFSGMLVVFLGLF